MKNSIVTDGLTFCYDMDNERSFAGRATTNNEHGANARLDSSYNAWTYNPGGTWTAKHHDAIQVFNNVGTDISSKVNSGVTDYTNTYHGIWTYDEELRQPVVTMRDIGNGTWMYAGFGLSGNVNTPAKLGLGVGDNYVISWDQWTTDTSKAANCGLYGQNTTNTQNNFHDGLSNSLGQSTSFNTKRHTWQRCWCVYTVNSNRGLNATWSQYNYGHYTTRGVTKVANWQLETGDTPSTFVKSTSATSESTRSTALIDVAGGNTITISDLTYSMDSNTRKEKFTFDGSNDRLLMNNNYPTSWTDPMSIEAWVYIPSGADWHNTTVGSNSGTSIMGRGSYSGSHGLLRRDTQQIVWWLRTDVTSYSAAATGLSFDTWYHCVGTWGGSGTATLYINGVAAGTTNPTWTSATSIDTGNWQIGGGVAFGGNTGSYGAGDIPVARMYNRALSVGEVRQNFNALRGRFGY